MEINEITYAINGAAFEVNRVLGPGFLEKVYENALLVELKRRGLTAESQVPKAEIKSLPAIASRSGEAGGDGFRFARGA